MLFEGRYGIGLITGMHATVCNNEPLDVIVCKLEHEHKSFSQGKVTLPKCYLVSFDYKLDLKADQKILLKPASSSMWDEREVL